jgi:O-methyltransferase involved in polyketide biosynthesis
MQKNKDITHVDLAGVNRTLLLPLWARARESQKPNAILIDHQAKQIVDHLSQKETYKKTFNEMDKDFDPYYQISQLIRAKCLDDEIQEFLQVHPSGTIVNWGAGLDTTFSRNDNGLLHWYDLDFPDVIELRKTFIPESERNKYIPKSLLDPSWYEDVEIVDQGLMFVACGVLFFLMESQVRQLFIDLVDAFPGSEAAFDTMTRLIMSIGNRGVLKQGGLDKRAIMQWSIRSARTMASWDKRIIVIKEYPMFSRTHFDESWDRSVVNRMRMINWMRGINIFRLRLGTPWL